MTTAKNTGVCFIALLICASAFVLIMYQLSEHSTSEPCVCNCKANTQPIEQKRPAVANIKYERESTISGSADTSLTTSVKVDTPPTKLASADIQPTKSAKAVTPPRKSAKMDTQAAKSVKADKPPNELPRRPATKVGDEFDKRVNKTNARCRFLPDILIFGFDKCGTMTLRQFLSVHPDIFITQKEGNNKFFKQIAENDYSHNSVAVSLNEKTECTPKGKLRLEKLVSSRYPESVYKYVPNIKLIAIVKEPVERTMSHYVHLVAQVEKSLLKMSDFDLCARRLVSSPLGPSSKALGNDHRCDGTNHIITTSMYATSLKKWVDIFGVENILIIDGDNFVSNPVEELRKAEDFIGLEHKISDSDFYYDKQKKFYCIREEGNTGCMSEKKGRPHPPMSNSTRKILKDFIKPYNEEFYKLIGRTFPWDD